MTPETDRIPDMYSGAGSPNPQTELRKKEAIIEKGVSRVIKEKAKPIIPTIPRKYRGATGDNPLPHDGD